MSYSERPHQAPLSMRFSRQEYWSGTTLKALFVVPSYLLFIKAVFHYVVVSSPSCVQLFATPIDYITPGSSVHGISQARILEWVAISFSRDLPNPGIKHRSPTQQVDSLPAEPQGQPKHTGVSSLSLVQWIFLTQESNSSLLHCRWILYQLSYQGSPLYVYVCL